MTTETAPITVPSGHAAAEPAIEVRGLQKHYGPVAAVRGIDLDVRRGEVFAFLGPNGAGKTTTVEILEGFRRADGGHVRVLGEDPATAGAAWRGRIGVVLQESEPDPGLDGAGDGRALRRLPRRTPQCGRDARAGRPGPIGRSSSRPGSRAASGADSMSRWPSSDGPSCCSWTSRRRASTRPPGDSLGR